MSIYKFFTVSDINDIKFITINEARLSNDYPINDLGRDLMNLLDIPDQKKFLFDLSNVYYMCSAMLCHLIKLQKFANEKGVSIKYIRANKDLKQVFKILCLNKLMMFYDTEEEALKSFENESKE